MNINTCDHSSLNANLYLSKETSKRLFMGVFLYLKKKANQLRLAIIIR